MSEIPTKAGQAILEYSPGAKHPSRSGNIITIPATGYKCFCGGSLAADWDYCPICGGRAIFDSPDIELFPLLDNFEQFLLLQKRPGERWPDVWFGGTDEAPFLVQMDQWVLDAYRSGHFYEYLIPTTMLTLVRKWGDNWKRQGDIFAYQLPFSWNDIQGIGDFNKANGLQVFNTEKERVFGTRHLLEGRWCHIMLAGRMMVVAEGVIKAPDHTDLVIERPHALDQTAHLHDPTKAD